MRSQFTSVQRTEHSRRYRSPPGAPRPDYSIHVFDNDSLEGWRLSVAMIPSRDPIGMFGVRNLRLGLPVLWGTDGTGRSAVILTYLAFGGMFFAVAIWCARQITREALLDHLSELDITITLVFVRIMVFCFLAAQNFM